MLLVMHKMKINKNFKKNKQSEDKYIGNMLGMTHVTSWLSGRARSYMDEVMGSIRQRSKVSLALFVMYFARPAL